jgi:hypothetical protein
MIDLSTWQRKSEGRVGQIWTWRRKETLVRAANPHLRNALLLGRGLNARLHHRRSQRIAGYPAIQALARSCGYKIPTFGLRQQTTPVATVGSISSLLMPPYPLSVPKSEETTHESASFDSRVEPYPGLHRNGFCCGKASSHPGCLREGPHDVECRY